MNQVHYRKFLIRPLCVFVGLFVISLALYSCKNITEVKLVEVTGQLTVDPNSEADSIEASFYKINDFEEEFSDIIQSSSELGLSNTRRLLFDHRNHTKAASALTDATGKFQVSLDRGTYHIALTKRGYGIKYLYDVVIQGESLSLNQLFDMPALTLLPEVIIGGVVETGTFVYDESRNLVVSGNTTFDAGTSIVFNPGAVVRLSPNSTLAFLGSVTIQGDLLKPVRIISDTGIVDTGSKPAIDMFDKIHFLPGSVVSITGLVMKDALTGLVSHTSLNISNSLLSGKEFCCQVLDTNNANIQSCIFLGSPESLNFALMLSFLSSALLERSLFYDCASAIRINSVANSTIQDNMILNSGLGLLVENFSNAYTMYNTLKCTQTGIRTYLNSNNDISYNVVDAPNGIEFTGTYSSGLLNNNNLKATNYALRYISYRSGDLDAEQNYWHTTATTAIDELIQDKHDFPSNDPNYGILNNAVYLPIRSSAVPSAGVRP